jgi:hypothetical protein
MANMKIEYLFPRGWNTYAALAWIRSRNLKVTLYKAARRLVAW